MQKNHPTSSQARLLVKFKFLWAAAVRCGLYQFLMLFRILEKNDLNILQAIQIFIHNALHFVQYLHTLLENSFLPTVTSDDACKERYLAIHICKDKVLVSRYFEMMQSAQVLLIYATITILQTTYTDFNSQLFQFFFCFHGHISLRLNLSVKNCDCDTCLIVCETKISGC